MRTPIQFRLDYSIDQKQLAEESKINTEISKIIDTERINWIKDINQDTIEGKLLVAAIVKMSVEGFPMKNEEDVIDRIYDCYNALIFDDNGITIDCTGKNQQ